MKYWQTKEPPLWLFKRAVSIKPYTSRHSKECLPDSQNLHSDAAKIRIYFDTSKYFSFFFFVESFFIRIFALSFGEMDDDIEESY